MFQQKQLFKEFAILSITASICSLSLMITLVFLGHQGFGLNYEEPNNSNDYLLQKFVIQIASRNKKRFIMLIFSLGCLVAHIFIILWEFLRQSNSKTTTVYLYYKTYYVLISLAVLFQIPVAAYYIAYIIENQPQTSAKLFNGIVIAVQSMAIIILMVVCLVIILKNNKIQLSKNQSPKAQEDILKVTQASPMNETYLQSQRNKESLLTEQSSCPLLQIQDLFGSESNEVRTEEHKETEKTCKFESISAKNYTNRAIPLFSENLHFITSMADKAKLSSKQKQEEHQKQMLKKQIQRKKRIFQSLSFIIQEQTFEESLLDDNQKNPNIFDLTKNQRLPIQSQIQRIPIITIQKQFAILPQLHEKKSKKLTNLFDSSNFTKEGMKEELVFKTTIQAAQRLRKPLFNKVQWRTRQELQKDGSNETTSNDDRQNYPKRPTIQQEIIMRLKKKYHSNSE